MYYIILLMILIVYSLSSSLSADVHHIEYHDDHHNHNQQSSMPSFIEPIGNHSVAVGRNIILQCSVNNLGNYKVAWLKLDKNMNESTTMMTLLTMESTILINDLRLKITNYNSIQWFLHINSVRRDDEGDYMCQINTRPMINQIGHLTVLTPPQLNELLTSRSDIVVIERQRLSLRCVADGNPKPTIQWRREDNKQINIKSFATTTIHDKVYKVNGEYLNISQVLRSDIGSYLCIATNGVQPSISKRIIVNVHFAPKIKVSNQLIGASITSSVQLECRCEAFPIATIRWIRFNGLTIDTTSNPNPNKYHIDNIIHDIYRIKMRLKIIGLSQTDYGSYRCIASNLLGEKEGLIRLYLTESTNNNNQRNEETQQQKYDLYQNLYNHSVDDERTTMASTTNKRRYNNNNNNNNNDRPTTNTTHKRIIHNWCVTILFVTILLLIEICS